MFTDTKCPYVRSLLYYIKPVINNNYLLVLKVHIDHCVLTSNYCFPYTIIESNDEMQIIQ